MERGKSRVRGVVHGRVVQAAAICLGALFVLAGPTHHASAAAPSESAKAAPEKTKVDATEAQIAEAKARVSKVYGNSIALVIGISHYTHMTPLTGAVRDAQAMAEVLGEHGFRVTLLLDDEATAGNIKRMLTSGAVEEIGEADRVFIYFAGHGVSVGEGHRAMGYLMPVEAHGNLAAAEGIDMEWLQRIFRIQYRAKHVMFVADACYSGLAISTRGAAPRGDKPDVLARLTEKPVRLALTAGSAGQQAHEEGGHGLFTYKLLKALRGSADAGNRDGVVTSAEIWSYVQSEVTQTAARKGYEQTPQFGREGEGEMLFANLSGAVGPSPFASATTTTTIISEPSSVMAWSTLGAGIVVASVGGWALYDGNAKWADGAAAYQAWDTHGGTTDGDGGQLDREAARREIQRLDEEGTRQANLGRILLGVGGALVATSAVFFLLDPSTEDAAPKATAVHLGVDGATGSARLEIRGRW